MALIEVKELHKSFGNQKVLEGIDLTVEEGQIMAIMGGSGTGKSVLLKHLIGLLRPDHGEIFVAGEEICHLKAKDMNRVRRKFGMLFQDAALFDDMNVFENVSFPLYEHSDLRDDEIEHRVIEKLTLVGLTDINHKMPSELSGGMRKRVGLARALMLDPEILLFDEPTTGLDPIITSQIADLLEETQKRLGITAIVISHDVALTYRLADQVAMLHGGHVVEHAPPEQFRRSKQPFVRQFLEAFETAVSAP